MKKIILQNPARENTILFEIGDFNVRKSPQGWYEVYQFSGTHDKRIGSFGGRSAGDEWLAYAIKFAKDKAEKTKNPARKDKFYVKDSQTNQTSNAINTRHAAEKITKHLNRTAGAQDRFYVIGIEYPENREGSPYENKNPKRDYPAYLDTLDMEQIDRLIINTKNDIERLKDEYASYDPTSGYGSSKRQYIKKQIATLQRDLKQYEQVWLSKIQS